MNKSLRVLCVEDSDHDAVLIRRHLERAGYDVISTRVQTDGAMRAALIDREWDVILCDYSMPQFDALRALAVVSEMRIDVPFIIISGTVGEVVAVEAMRAGAHDYLMKDNLVRLAATIERELQEAANRRARRHAEEALQTSEAELRALFAAMTDVILVFDSEGRHLKVAPSKPARMYKPDRLGKTLHEIFAKEKADFFVAHISQALAEHKPHRVEYELEIEGEPLWFEGSASPMNKTSVIWIARDITERKRAEEALRESEERYRDFVENAHDIIYSHDLQGNYTSVNTAGEQITGYTLEETLHLNLSQTVTADCLEKAKEMLARKLAGERVTAYELELLAKNGRRIAVEVNTRLLYEKGQPVSVQGIARDITERKQLEEQFRQSQKMEAIGQLAGGVAHDFNNLLTVINGYSSLALQRMPDEDPLRENLEEISKAGERAANLTRQLLAFGRKQMLQPVALNLNDVISDLNKMLRRLIGENIKLTAKFDPALRKIRADPGQIEQVIVNLVVNARDAMPQGGHLTIETANFEVDSEYAGSHIGVGPGSYAMLAVTDSGVGMNEQTKARIFEPFFTTKEKGKGTGLGLSTVYGIVQQSGGNIWVYSEAGTGTSFKIYLPELIEPEREAKAASASANTMLRGTETILLVEDEEVVRGLTQKILEESGYHVLTAGGGDEALQLCSEKKTKIDLLLTDVVMPGASGKEVADRLGDMVPGIKVLFMSGYTDESIVHHGVLDSNVEFIQKPFTPVALSRKVREVLDSNGQLKDKSDSDTK